MSDVPAAVAKPEIEADALVIEGIDSIINNEKADATEAAGSLEIEGLGEEESAALEAVQDAALQTAEKISESFRLDPLDPNTKRYSPWRNCEIPPRVMVVDEDSSTWETMSMALVKGFEVVAATDIQEAVGRGTRWQPDLFIIDADKLELVNMLRQSESTTSSPIIVLTEKANAQQQRSVLRSGANLYLEKPFYPIYLGLKLEALVGSTGFQLIAPKRMTLTEIMEESRCRAD